MTTTSYWNNTGRFQNVADKLQEMLPASGEVEDPKNNPALEKFRKAVNVYYDVFNNGLCNRGREFPGIFGFGASQYKTVRVHLGRGRSYMQFDFDAVAVPMDKKMDELILAAAVEQDLVGEVVLKDA